MPSLCCPEQAKWCQSLCNSMDHSQSGSSVHVILQTRILEGVAMPSSRGSGNLPNPGIRTTSYVSCIGRQVLYHWRHLGSPSVCIHVFNSPYLQVTTHPPTLHSSISCCSLIFPKGNSAMITSPTKISVFTWQILPILPVGFPSKSWPAEPSI